MKKIFLLLIACASLVMPAEAQHYYGTHPNPSRTAPRRTTVVVQNGPVGNYRYGNSWNKNYYIGLRLGCNFATVRSDQAALDGNSTRTGLNVGLAAGFQLTYHTPLYFETGLYYTEKGGKSNNGTNGGKFTYNLGYLEVPLVFKYNYQATRDVAVCPYLGGFLAGGIAGNIKDYKEREAFSSFDDGYFNRFDGGLRFGCGVQFQMIYLEANYDLGLANVGQNDFDETHTGAFTLSVGVNF